MSGKIWYIVDKTTQEVEKIIQVSGTDEKVVLPDFPEDKFEYKTSKPEKKVDSITVRIKNWFR